METASELIRNVRDINSRRGAAPPRHVERPLPAPTLEDRMGSLDLNPTSPPPSAMLEPDPYGRGGYGDRKHPQYPEQPIVQQQQQQPPYAPGPPQPPVGRPPPGRVPPPAFPAHDTPPPPRPPPGAFDPSHAPGPAPGYPHSPQSPYVSMLNFFRINTKMLN